VGEGEAARLDLPEPQGGRMELEVVDEHGDAWPLASFA